MKRRPDEPELWGAHETAEALGVNQTNVRKVPGLPEPYGRIAATTLWRAVEIRALAFQRMQEGKQNRITTAQPPPPVREVQVAEATT